MRVLFLSFTSGQGHNMACRAMMAYLEPRGVECRMLDALECIDPRLSRVTDRTYTHLAKYTPSVWGGIYRLNEKVSSPTTVEHLPAGAHCVLAKRLIRTVRSFVPDAVVCSHVYDAMVVHAMRKQGLLAPHVVCYGINTDFTLHPYWESSGMDYLVLGSPYLKYGVLRRGVREETLLPTGIPVNPLFAQPRDPDARASLGLADKPTFLLMAGSIGMNALYDAVASLVRMPEDIQVITVCGKNERLREKITSLGSPHIIPLGYVNNVHRLMDAADWIITKPGGLSTSESLAKNLPMLLIDPIPGVEDRNRDFLVNMGMAMACPDIRRLDDTVRFLLDCPERAETIRDCQRRFAPRDSARVLGEHILAQCAARKPLP